MSNNQTFDSIHAYLLIFLLYITVELMPRKMKAFSNIIEP
jgi:hypothetical protein